MLHCCLKCFVCGACRSLVRYFVRAYLYITCMVDDCEYKSLCTPTKIDVFRHVYILHEVFFYHIYCISHLNFVYQVVCVC